VEKPPSMVWCFERFWCLIYVFSELFVLCGVVYQCSLLSDSVVLPFANAISSSGAGKGAILDPLISRILFRAVQGAAAEFALSVR